MGKKRIVEMIDEIGKTTGEGFLQLLNEGDGMYGEEVFEELVRACIADIQEVIDDGILEAGRNHVRLSAEALIDASNNHFGGYLREELVEALDSLDEDSFKRGLYN